MGKNITHKTGLLATIYEGLIQINKEMKNIQLKKDLVICKADINGQ